MRLNIPDLDQGFRLKTQTMLAIAVPLMYEQFTEHIDVAALRAAGYGSVVTSAEFSRGPQPLAVGGELDARVETRQVELSGKGLGQRSSRIGFECRYTFAARPGTGDPSRYRETVAGTPVVCGQARLLLTLIRRDGAPGRRVVNDVLPETRHLGVHQLDDPHPAAAALAQPPEATTVAAGDRDGVFGLSHTDTNQVVFTGEHLSLLEGQLAWLLAEAGREVAAWSVERVAMVFREPFRAGDRFRVRGRLWDDGTAVIGVHPDGADQPAVVGRLTLAKR
ncbi:hypothetical protein BJY16_008571 [Actinoplanes octamycinicus]|uniref:MaoC dehydratase-like protein n=1 Tax=Actinoplanes octamycinicus TaxID=135948 RepID=A0A7W7MCG1_9ACTN|nr:hypothetical protein [Actinoplanes octamycinicus]MBB4745112.1 hypothetical protein [Actinoplanes octamycinicus]